MNRGRTRRSSGSRKARNSFFVLGALLTIACVDVFTQSQQCVGVQVGVASRSYSVSTRMGTSGRSTDVDIIEYNAGGRTRELDVIRQPSLMVEGDQISWEPSGEKVVVWYYGRLPKFAWVGERRVGTLVTAFFVATYWAVLVAVLRGFFRPQVGRPQRK